MPAAPRVARGRERAVGTAFDRWDKALRFEVDQSGIYDQGSVVVDGTWTVTGRSARRVDHSSSARR